MIHHKHIQNSISVVLALVVLIGIALHDTKLDYATKFAIALPAVLAAYEGSQLFKIVSSGEAHTHVERVSMHSGALKLSGNQPRIHTRNNEYFHYKSPNNATKGRHPFDNYSLPVVS